MPCDKKALLEFLEILNGDLTKKITLVAVGGTAMTLLDLKPSTIDIDFTIPSNDLPEFERALKGNPPGFKIDRWADGYVFCQSLPNDYLDKSIKIKKYSHIQLKALQLVDIVVTKIGRLKPKRHPRHRNMHQKIQNHKRRNNHKSKPRKPNICSQRKRLPIPSKMGHKEILLIHH